MTTIWVLVVWLTTTLPATYVYPNKAECEAAGDMYSRHSCISIQVPMPRAK